MKVWLDTESVGLVGRVKTVQYIVEEAEPRVLYLPEGWRCNPDCRHYVDWLYPAVWRNPNATLFAYNASHDVFKLAQLFHEWLGFSDDSPERPVPPPLCKVIDLYIHAALKSPLAPYLNRGGRHVASIRRVPLDCVPDVIDAVETELYSLLPSVLGLKRSEHEVKDRPDLLTLSWRIKQGMRLKTLMRYYGLPTLDLFELWPLPKHDGYSEVQPHPYEEDWHRTASRQCDTIMADPGAPFHRYAMLDPVYTKLLWHKIGCPTVPTDNDTCTAMVGYTRYHGFSQDRAVLETTAGFYRHRIDEAERNLHGINPRSSKQRVELLQSYIPLIQSSKKQVLQQLAKVDGPVQPVALAMLNYGMYKQRLAQLEIVETCRTGHMHIDFKVLGTATNRMSGASGLNGQGIAQAEKWADYLREEEAKEWQDGELEEMEYLEPDVEHDDPVHVGLRASTLTQYGGDFDAVEMTIMPAVFGDKQLQADLDNGIDPHIMGLCLVRQYCPEWADLGLTYEQAVAIRADKSHPLHDKVESIRKRRGKGLNFGLAYGAQAMKVDEVLGAGGLVNAQLALDLFFDRYKGIREFRERNSQRFETADTDWWDPNSVARMDTESEDLLGFKRYYTFEKDVACIFWELGRTGIRLSCAGRVVRQEQKGEQSYKQAVRSACLGAAITVQQAVSRQAGNHPIQGTGSGYTKRLCAEVWNAFHCPMMNVHDELQGGRSQHYVYDQNRMDALVQDFLERHRPLTPSLNIKIEKTERWSDK